MPSLHLWMPSDCLQHDRRIIHPFTPERAEVDLGPATDDPRLRYSGDALASQLCGGSCDFGGDCVDGSDAWADGQADALHWDRNLPRASDVPRTERNTPSTGGDRRSDHRRRNVYLNPQNSEKGLPMYTVFSIIGSLVLGFVLGMVHKQRVLKKLCRHDGDCVK